MELHGDRLIPAPRDKTFFDGQASVSRVGKGLAGMPLSVEGASTRLKYNARALVGGKMAQVGSPVIDAVAPKVPEDLEAHLRLGELAEERALALGAGRSQQDAAVGGGRCDRAGAAVLPYAMGASTWTVLICRC